MTFFNWTSTCNQIIYIISCARHGKRVSFRTHQRSHHIAYHLGSTSLFATTLKQLKWPILAVVPPRACLIAFNYCQPFLIERAVNYSNQDSSAQDTNIGYGLIGAYVLVYVGIAVSRNTCTVFSQQPLRITVSDIARIPSQYPRLLLSDVDGCGILVLILANHRCNRSRQGSINIAPTDSLQ
jgi:hypothetical protein